MHQAILTRAERNWDIIKKGRLRLIRSSSSSLPPQVMEALEETFHVPVIESYGMTEASHQMASNPLPPRQRFSGCVGIAAGPDVAIMDENGTLLERPARWARSSSAAAMSPRATKPTPTPMPRPLPMAGSAPVTRACLTQMAICGLPGG